MPTILVIDDDIDTLKLVDLMLKKSGYRVMTAPSAALGMEKMKAERPDCIILDIMMPGKTGIELLKELNQIRSTPPVILFSAKRQIPDVIEGMEAGAFRYLVKTATREQLVKAIEDAIADPRSRPTTREERPTGDEPEWWRRG
ncbi:MAG: response regulator [Anaerolineales bacterium]